MTVVTKMHETSFIFITYVMSWLWRCHVSLMHTPSSKVLPIWFKKWILVVLLTYLQKFHIQVPCILLMHSVVLSSLKNTSCVSDLECSGFKLCAHLWHSVDYRTLFSFVYTNAFTCEVYSASVSEIFKQSFLQCD